MQILTDTHCHTLASSHAYSTIHDYLAQAKLNGIQLLSITDHAPPMPDAPHLWHFVNYRVIPRLVDNIAILRGAEANIEALDGSFSLDPRFDSLLDFAIASFHEPVFAPADRDTCTQALINTIAQGRSQIVGHPGNPNFPLDVDAVVDAAKQHNVLIEINNSSLSGSRVGSEQNCEAILQAVKRHNWKISLGSDAHIAFQLGEFSHCIELIKRVGFAEQQIVSATPLRFLRFLAEHGKPVAEELMPWAEAL